MQLFRNEFGDLIVWRVATATTVSLALSAGLAFAVGRLIPDALATHQGTVEDTDASIPASLDALTSMMSLTDTTGIDDADGTEDQENTGTENATSGAADTASPGLTPEAAEEATIDQSAPPDTPTGMTIAGEELLGSLTAEARAALAAALDAWATEAQAARPHAFTALAAPEVAADATRVRVRLDAASGTRWLEATIAPGATWQVTEHAEGFAMDPTAAIPIANVALLSQVTGGAVAGEVERQLSASGLPGAESAWTTREAITCEGTITHLSLWLPTTETEAERYYALFDTSVGLLEIWPEAAASTEEVR